MTEANIALSALIALVAFMYSSVGHAGASGYFAVLSLAGWAPAEIRPLALVLNVLVASVASFKYMRAGHFRARLFWPFALLSVPAAALGGYLELPAVFFSRLIGIVLLLSALWMLARRQDAAQTKAPTLSTGITTGALLGFIAGLTGTGGGIFLSPLMLLCRWASIREVSAVAAPFILLNSLAGLGGLSLKGVALPQGSLILIASAVVSGTLGAQLGSRVF